MNIAEILRRALIGGGIPPTETVQQQLMNYLTGHGAVDSEHLYDRIELPGQPGHRRLAIDQAAQILVNQARVKATLNGVPVDPINASGKYRLSLTLPDEARQ